MSRPGALLVVAGVVTIAAACSAEPARQSADILAEVLAEADTRTVAPLPASPSLARLPATFTGLLPCADCPGVRYHLNIFANRSFFLRAVYIDRGGRPFDDIGTWSLGTDRRTLTLRGGREARRQFVIKDGRTLRQLDINGREIESARPYDLVRADVFEPFEPTLALQGLYSYMADAGNFTECLTRQRWPVAMEAASAELERAYLAARRTPGQEVLVSVDARIALRPPMEGSGLRETLVVDRVVGAWPDRSCSRRVATASIDQIAWAPTHAGGAPIEVAGLPLAPFLELRPGSRQFSASDGCNRIVGSYQQDEARLTFSIGAVTRIGCPEGSQVNRAFSDALAATRSWRIVEDRLELLNDRGEAIARFEPRQ